MAIVILVRHSSNVFKKCQNWLRNLPCRSNCNGKVSRRQRGACTYFCKPTLKHTYERWYTTAQCTHARTGRLNGFLEPFLVRLARASVSRVVAILEVPLKMVAITHKLARRNVRTHTNGRLRSSMVNCLRTYWLALAYVRMQGHERCRTPPARLGNPGNVFAAYRAARRSTDQDVNLGDVKLLQL